MSKLFTCIVPSHNRSSFVIEALDSIKKQNYRPIEIVFIDDGSTDSTKSIIEKWTEKSVEDDSFSLRYIYQENAGASSARNRGIKEITGEYVQFLDSDDRLHPERLAQLVEVFEETGADFIQTGFDGFDSKTGEIIEQHFARPDENQVELALYGLLWANTLRSAFTKSLVDRIGLWDTSMTCFEDREYVERAVVQAEKPVAIRDILTSARRGGSERVSDRLRTYEGRSYRVLCEERLANSIKCRKDISYKSKQAFASRIYALGFRSNASGWPDLGKKCGEIAESMDVDLDIKGYQRRLVWKSGRLGGYFYSVLSKLKRQASSV